ncbi:MAG TPA: tetratricopeptide repeat protein [Tepidisphaeraceae bacterium]|nr:tetratricopeptide repeat protein [Tepidisphaeraceae bacterium]
MSDTWFMRIYLSFLAILAVTAGCQDQNKQGLGGLQRISDAEAVNLSSGQSHFDNSQDPPFTAATRFAAGQLAESMNQQPRAIAQYNEAIKLDPRHQPSLYRLGVLYAQLHQYDDAVNAWKQYVKATDSSATAYSNLAYCYELAGRPADAEGAYKLGIKRDPNNRSCRIHYGVMLVKQGKASEGTRQFEVVLKPAEVHYNVAAVYEQMGRKEDAKLEYEKALELDPNLADAHERLSQLE